MKVLIIDDEPDILTYLSAALEDADYEVATLDKVIPTENFMAAHKPDLIILDIMMPERSGISIYKELRAHEAYQSIPILLISGMPAKDFMAEGFQKLIGGASIKMPDGFIEKPVHLAKFIKTIHQFRK